MWLTLLLLERWQNKVRVELYIRQARYTQAQVGTSLQPLRTWNRRDSSSLAKDFSFSQMFVNTAKQIVNQWSEILTAIVAQNRFEMLDQQFSAPISWNSKILRSCLYYSVLYFIAISGHATLQWHNYENIHNESKWRVTES